MNRQSAGKTLEILSKYKELNSIIETAKFFNVSYETIRIVLRKNGFVSNKKKPVYSNTLKADYFKEINTEDKAYFYGLIKADGYIDKTRNRFALRLQERDVEILKRFCDALNLPQERLNRITRSEHSVHYSPNRSDCFELAITHREFTSYLMDVKEESSLRKVPEHLVYHFIRGYFDGDGSISYSNVKKLKFQINIMGSPNDDHMLKFVCKYFDFGIYIDKRSNLPFINCSVFNKIVDFREKCYSDCFVYLSRKKIKFDLVKFTKETSTTIRGTSHEDEDIV